MIVMKYSYQITVSEMSYFLTFLMQDETQDLESIGMDLVHWLLMRVLKYLILSVL